MPHRVEYFGATTEQPKLTYGYITVIVNNNWTNHTQ